MPRVFQSAEFRVQSAVFVRTILFCVIPGLDPGIQVIKLICASKY